MINNSKNYSKINNAIYIHIPFCKQACYYCNFHFNVNINMIDDMVNCLVREIEIRKAYLNTEINSIYFGGGTPSILSQSHINSILNTIYKNFKISENIEITFECNPDDLNNSKFEEIKALGINRLSIGIQTFNNKALKYLNRAHNSQKALKTYELARKHNFKNINIDLIYGIPINSIDDWKKDLEIITQLKPEHISSYCLTIEKNTYFGTLYSRGKLKIVGEDMEAKLFDILVENLQKANYEHYEVSNFCIDNKYSKHNTNYWKKGNYLGIGPSAHSYNGISRQWNISNNKKYIDNIKSYIPVYTKEILTGKDHINEYIMTSLRTKWGCDLEFLINSYDYNLLEKSENLINESIENNLMNLNNKTLILTHKGFKLADKICSNLFILD
ncbi:MAG: radical SAM family heme chaperone HemW [Bacteroidetes bacterium]|nr:radical SAM family heme chaperone HemW [Bacteroidota bacterium]